jgi:hypothetical protein
VHGRLGSPLRHDLLRFRPGFAGPGTLSTNPDGNTSSGQVLDTDTGQTENVVAGYWLNVPVQGTACEQCQPGWEPQVAVDYLHALGYTG